MLSLCAGERARVNGAPSPPEQSLSGSALNATQRIVIGFRRLATLTKQECFIGMLLHQGNRLGARKPLEVRHQRTALNRWIVNFKIPSSFRHRNISQVEIVGRTTTAKVVRKSGRSAAAVGDGNPIGIRVGAATHLSTQRPPALFVILEVWAKYLIYLAPRAGFEPATIRLTVECSTAELPRNRRNPRVRTRDAYNKASERCKGRNRPFWRFIDRGTDYRRHGESLRFWIKEVPQSGHLAGDPPRASAPPRGALKKGALKRLNRRGRSPHPGGFDRGDSNA